MNESIGLLSILDEGGMGIVSMLFCTSLVALVGAGEQPSLSPRKLTVVNTKASDTNMLSKSDHHDCPYLCRENPLFMN